MNSKTFKSIALIAALGLALGSCSFKIGGTHQVKAEGADVTGTAQIGNFNKIEANQGITVNYKVGNTVSIDYIVPESLKPYFEIKNDEGTLECKFHDISVSLDNRNVVVNVTAPAVYSFEASSLATINALDTIRVHELELEASSSSTINIAAAIAQKAEIDASSSSTISVAYCEAQEAELDASSASEIDFNGNIARLDAESSSSSTINIAGTCGYLRAEASSAGTVDANRATVESGNLSASSGADINVPQPQKSPYTQNSNSGGSIKVAQ